MNSWELQEGDRHATSFLGGRLIKEFRIDIIMSKDGYFGYAVYGEKSSTGKGKFPTYKECLEAASKTLMNDTATSL